MRRFLTIAVLLSLAACAASPVDEKLEEAVRAGLRQHPGLAVDNLTIHSENGVVYLSGLVANDVEQTEAEQVAKATPGVKKVVNMTSVDNSRY